MNQLELQAQINKRLTLNLLIQGTASHYALDAHRSVQDAMADLSPDLVNSCEKLAASFFLSQHSVTLFDFTGWFGRWSGRIKGRGWLLSQHPLIRRHGRQLARAGRRQCAEHARSVGAWHRRGTRVVKGTRLLLRAEDLERRFRRTLVRLACESVGRTWGIDPGRLRGTLTHDCEVGRTPAIQTLQAKLLRLCAGGWSHVIQLPDGQLGVQAKAWVWPLLAHELNKGVAELVCLHGLMSLEESEYDRLIKLTDRIEYELAMLRIGPELFHRLLSVIEAPHTPALALMHLAQLEPNDLEAFALALVQDLPKARRLLGDLLDAYVDIEPLI